MTGIDVADKRGVIGYGEASIDECDTGADGERNWASGWVTVKVVG